MCTYIVYILLNWQLVYTQWHFNLESGLRMSTTRQTLRTLFLPEKSNSKALALFLLPISDSVLREPQDWGW